MTRTSRGFDRAAGQMRGVVTLTLTVLATLAALAVVASTAAARPSGSVTFLGAAPARGSIGLALPLAANVSGLQRFATAVSTPGSRQYGRYQPTRTLARRFGASGRVRAQVMTGLRRAGATHIRIDVTGLFADATMKVGQAQRLFGVRLGEFRSVRATRYTAPEASVRIPADLRGAVTGVVGLDTQPVFGTPAVHSATGDVWPHRPAVAAPAWARVARDATSGYGQRTGTAAGCHAAVAQSGFTPNQYLGAYGYVPLQAVGLQGQGERVALIEIDGFKYADLRTFSKCFGLATPAINGYGVGLRKPLPAGGESTLDLEVLDAAAPKLRTVDVYESRPSATDVLRSLTAPLSNHGSRPDVISASLGSCEQATVETIGYSGLRAVEGSLAFAAASGISVVASSGDDGSSACLRPGGQPVNMLGVSFPASSPWVTGVGGTNLTLDETNQIVSQTVWNDSPAVVAAGGGGGSGQFRRPGYQNGFAPGTRRAVPDVSMLADVAPGYEIYCTAPGACVTRRSDSPWTQVGGTSAAAPLLAGGLALVDQALRRSGHQAIGLANPLLYAIARSPAGGSVFNDVTQGSNDLGTAISGGPLSCCTATTGYDEASGLGSVNLSGLLLTAQSIVPKIASVGLWVPRQRRPVAAEHLLARVSCAGHCLYGAYVRLQLGGSRHVITQASSPYLLRRGGRRTIRIPFTRATLITLRRALARREPIRATVYGAVLDPNGSVETQSRGVTLRITG